MFRSFLDHLQVGFKNKACILHKYLNRLIVLPIKCVDVINSVVEVEQDSTYPDCLGRRDKDMQKIRIIGFFFKNRLHWQSEVRLCLHHYSLLT